MLTRSPRWSLRPRGAHRERLAEADAGDRDRAARDRRQVLARRRARPPSAAWRPSGAGRRRRRGPRGAAPARPRRPARARRSPAGCARTSPRAPRRTAAPTRASPRPRPASLTARCASSSLGAVGDLAVGERLARAVDERRPGPCRAPSRAGRRRAAPRARRRRSRRRAARRSRERRAAPARGSGARTAPAPARRHEQVARLAGPRQVVDVEAGSCTSAPARPARSSSRREALDAAQNTGVST